MAGAIWHALCSQMNVGWPAMAKKQMHFSREVGCGSRVGNRMAESRATRAQRPKNNTLSAG